MFGLNERKNIDHLQWMLLALARVIMDGEKNKELQVAKMAAWLNYRIGCGMF